MALQLLEKTAAAQAGKTDLAVGKLKVPGKPGIHFEIVDSATGKTPLNIVVKKVGDNALMLVDDVEVEIEGFYAQGATSEIALVPLEGAPEVITPTSAPLAQLADGSSVIHGLDALPATAAGPLAAPLLGGMAGPVAGGAAVAAGAAGGGAGGSPSSPPADATAPSAPVISTVATDNQVNASEKTAGVTVTGTAEAGSTVSVTWGGNTKTATATGGNWSVSYASGEIPADGDTTISATATDAAGNASAAGSRSVSIDTTAPSAQSTNAVASDNIINAGEQNSAITGTNESGASVALSLGGNTRAATVTGTTWSYTLTAADITAMGQGAELIQATQTDAAGNTSMEGTYTITVDTVTPAFASGSTTAVAENAAASTPVYDATADGDTGVSYTLSGTDAALFNINAGTGAVTFKASPNHEAPADSGGDNVYDFTITATDTAGNSASQTAQVTVTDVAETTTLTGTPEADTFSFAAGIDDFIIAGLAGNDSIATGSGNDIIRPGEGVDSVTTGAGNDIVVLVGETAVNEYTQSDISNPAGSGIDLTSLITLADLNGRTVSEVAPGESIDGGSGTNRLVIYGNVDLTGVNLTHVSQLQVNSTVTVSAQRLNSLGLTLLSGDGDSVLNIGNSGSDPVTLDLTGMNFSDFRTLTIASGVTVVADQADIDSLLYLSGDGAIKASTTTGALNLTGKYTTLTVEDKDGTIDATHGDGTVVAGKLLIGSESPETLTGSSSGDRIEGGAGDDILVGGDGNDVLRGGAGVDSMDGGAGDDTFVVVGDLSGGGKVDSAADTAALGFALTKLNGQNLNEDDSGAVEIIRGGDGEDTLFVYGTADLSHYDISGIEHIEIRSDVTLERSSFENNAIKSINGDHSSTLRITSNTPFTLNLAEVSAPALTNLGEVSVGSNVVINISTINQLGGANVLSGAGSILSTEGNDIQLSASHLVSETLSIKNNSDGSGTSTALGGANIVSELVIHKDFPYDSEKGYGAKPTGNGGFHLYGSEGNERINGTFKNDVLYSRAGADYLYGKDGNDRYFINGNGVKTIVDASGDKDTLDLSGLVTGSYVTLIDLATGGEAAGATIIFKDSTRENPAIEDYIGTDGADVVTANNKNNYINGSAGEDKVIFSGNHADYVFTPTKGGVIVRDRTPGRDGIDTLSSIETLQFQDKSVLFNQIVPGDTESIFQREGYYDIFFKLSSASYWHADFTGDAQPPGMKTKPDAMAERHYQEIQDAGIRLLTKVDIDPTGVWLDNNDLTAKFENGFYVGYSTSGLDANYSSVALVGRSDDAIFITFRGSDVLTDWLDDFGPGIVAGMEPHYDRLRPLFDSVRQYIADSNGQIKKVYVSGHSLGGQLAAMYMDKHPDGTNGVTYEAVTYEAANKLILLDSRVTDTRYINFEMRGDPVPDLSVGHNYGLTIHVDAEDASFVLPHTRAYIDEQLEKVLPALENNRITKDIRIYVDTNNDGIVITNRNAYFIEEVLDKPIDTTITLAEAGLSGLYSLGELAAEHIDKLAAVGVTAVAFLPFTSAIAVPAAGAVLTGVALPVTATGLAALAGVVALSALEDRLEYLIDYADGQLDILPAWNASMAGSGGSVVIRPSPDNFTVAEYILPSSGIDNIVVSSGGYTSHLGFYVITNEALTLSRDFNITASASDHDVFIVGNNAENILVGSAYNDTLIGAGGEDALLGGDGKDFLYGGDYTAIKFDIPKGRLPNSSLEGYMRTEGDNVSYLIGGEGGDDLWGSGNNDYYFIDFTSNEPSGYLDTIHEFNPSNSNPLHPQDIIVFSAQELGIDLSALLSLADKKLFNVLGKNAWEVDHDNYQIGAGGKESDPVFFMTYNSKLNSVTGDVVEINNSGYLHFDIDGNGPILSRPLVAFANAVDSLFFTTGSNILLMDNFDGLKFNGKLLSIPSFDTTKPIFTSAVAAAVAENTPNNTNVYDATADGDVGVEYSISGTDHVLFNINPSTGEVTFIASPNFEAPTDSDHNNVYDFTIAAKDTDNNSSTLTVHLTVTDVAETPINATDRSTFNATSVSIATGAYDLESFTLNGEQYLAVAKCLDNGAYNLNSAIYKWNGSQFTEVQTIATHGAVDFESFTMNGERYLAVANWYNGSSYNINSVIYKWDGIQFSQIQAIATHGAHCWESFTLNGEQYLALANVSNDSSYNLYSVIYKWNGSQFAEAQTIATHGATDFESFTMNGELYLALANWHNDSSRNTDSFIYKWNGNQFTQIQAIPTHGAFDFESFTFNGEQYLAVANYHNDSSYNTDSVIYKWNGSQFAAVQTIATSGAAKWESFTLNGEQFLAVANHYNDTSYSIDSAIYKLTGNQFTQIQTIATFAAANWENFTLNGEQYLVAANQNLSSTSDIRSIFYKYNTATGHFDPATQTTLDLGTDEDTPQVIAAASLLANDGVGATGITAVSATAVDSTGVAYATVTLSGSHVVVTPNATADALNPGDIKDLAFTYTNNLGDTVTAVVRMSGLANDPVGISGAGYSYDLTAAGAQTLALNVDDIASSQATSQEPANQGNGPITGQGGWDQFNTGNGWSNVSNAALGANVDKYQAVVDGTSADTLSLVGQWINVGTVSHLGNQYTVYNSATGEAQVVADSDVAVTGGKPLVTTFDDEFSEGSLDTSLWSTSYVQSYQGHGNAASWTISNGQLYINNPGGSNGYMGMGDGTRFIPTIGSPLSGDFEVVVSTQELQRTPVLGNKDNSGIALELASTNGAERVSIGIYGDYSGYYSFGYGYNTYHGHRIDSWDLTNGVSSDFIHTELEFGVNQSVDFRIRSTDGVIYTGYRLSPDAPWIESIVSNPSSGMEFTPSFMSWSGDGGYTYHNGQFNASVDYFRILQYEVLTPPVFTSADTASVAENTPTSTTVYDATADNEVGVIYTIGGTDAALFNFDSGNGTFSFKNIPDFEHPADAGGNNLYDFTVTATDTAGNATDQAVQLAVTDVNEAPQALYTLSGSINGVSVEGWKLIHPTTVNVAGVDKTFYYLDASGDGSSAGADYVNHQTLDYLFNSNSTPGNPLDTTDANRSSTALIPGKTVLLPSAPSSGYQLQDNQDYPSDLAEIWDANNSGQVTNDTPAGWAHANYWSATQRGSDDHFNVNLYYGYVNTDYSDGILHYVAFQVL